MKLSGYLLLFACFIPLFIFRDFTPNNELKYLSIADEALQNGNIFTFWNHGVAYADKPPLYLWIVMLGKWLLGTHSMFFIGLFSIIPAFVILYVMDKWVARIIPVNLRISGQLMLITSGLFIGSAVVVRMDMLMCMFIVLSVYTFYKLYTGEGRKSDKILLPVYIFMAIFSKGPVGILVPLLSISVFLMLKGEIRNFGKYLGWKQWSILFGLCIVWFGGVYWEGGNTYLNNLLFNQTVNRAIDSFHHKEPFYYYFKTIWYSLAPWILLYVVAIAIGVKKHLLNNDLKKLFLTVIATTFVALSFFSGKLDIYMLPVFPFFAYLALLMLPEIKTRYISFTIAIPAAILTLAFPALFIVSCYTQFPVLEHILIPISVFLLSSASLLALIFLFKQRIYQAIITLASGLLITIFTGSFTIPSFNNVIGFEKICNKAKKMAYTKNIESYYCYKLRSGENMDAYLQQKVNKIKVEELSNTTGSERFILFLEQEDLIDDKDLYPFIKDRDVHSEGKYSFVIFE